MKVEVFGGNDPELSVIYSTHGDEVAGKKAIERFLEENPDFRRPVQFILANEKAFDMKRRFVDRDLNRSYPGDPESKIYEERIASEILKQVSGTKVLDLHETDSKPVPFALFCSKDKDTVETLISTGVERAVEISFTPGCGINVFGGVEVETGPKGSDQSVKMTERMLRNFLASQGAIEGDTDTAVPEIYSVTGMVERPDGDWSSKVQNFQFVEENQLVAESKQGEKIEAKVGFYPVLFSEGYEDMLGFEAARLENLEELWGEKFDL